MKETLRKYARNVHSQFGEDGIIEKIFELIGVRTRRCIEFGAWDGWYLSNTAHLWENGWTGVLIEADPKKYAELELKTSRYDCIRICERVGHQGEQKLDRILERHGVRGEVDLLSLDVDGDEYYIWEATEQLTPRVVVCEFNPTIPLHLELRQAPGGYFGCSATAMVRLAERKGYRLVAMTECNGLFVRASEFAPFEAFETSLEAVMLTQNLTYVISGYGGAVTASRPPTFGWTGSLQEPVLGDWEPFPIFPVPPPAVPPQSSPAPSLETPDIPQPAWWKRVSSRWRGKV